GPQLVQAPHHRQEYFLAGAFGGPLVAHQGAADAPHALQVDAGQPPRPGGPCPFLDPPPRMPLAPPRTNVAQTGPLLRRPRGRIRDADHAVALGLILVRQPPDASRTIRVLLEPGEGHALPGGELDLSRRRAPAASLEHRRELGPRLKFEAVLPEVAEHVVKTE